MGRSTRQRQRQQQLQWCSCSKHQIIPSILVFLFCLNPNVKYAVSFSIPDLLDSDSCEKNNDDCITVEQNKSTPDLSFKSPELLDETDKCKIYLAESSIPNSGLGMYSTVDVVHGEVIGTPQIVIPYNQEIAIIGMMEAYYWNAPTSAEGREGRALIKPGFGMAANSHLGLVNVHHPDHPKSDNGGLHRSIHPGAGAISAYHGQHFRAHREVLAGDELFEDYGSDYFLNREETMGKIPVEEHYEQADALLGRANMLFSGKANHVTEDLKEIIWTLIRNSLDDERTHIALPKTAAEIDHALEVGSAKHALPNSTRSVAWIEENGQCMDNIREGPSTIDGAGRGAFTVRSIPKGSLVAPAPLLTIGEEALQFAKRRRNKHTGALDMSEPFDGNNQLLLNYCFGHRNSSIILFPYSSTVHFINHKRDNPNAEIRWSTNPLFKRDWLKESASEVNERRRAGLMFDVIATRDILAGEEVFIDYGKGWDEAWDKHRQEWRPVDGAEKYSPAYEADAADLVLKTVFEEINDPYPENYRTMCYYEFAKDDDGNIIEEEYDLMTANIVNDIDLEEIVEHTFEWESRNLDDYLHPCKLLARLVSDNEIHYMALIMQKGESGEKRAGAKRFVSHIPREGIKLMDKSYTTDQHLPNAFRHYMEIPDDIFPSTWMNR